MKQKNDIIKLGDIGGNIEKVLSQPATRREFLRKTGLATLTLPMLGLLGLVSKTTKAVGPNDPGCNVCDFACQAQCRDDCDTTCQNECGSQCSVACTGSCDGSCDAMCGDCDTSCGGCGGSCGSCLGGGGGGQGGDGCEECDGSCSRNCASSASSHPSNSGGCEATAVDVSAYSTQYGCFQGYAERCTPNKIFPFATGTDFIDGLKDITTEHGEIGNLYIFSHAWWYLSASGTNHDGGFFGGGSNNSGFYGNSNYGGHSNHRTLMHLQQEMNNNTIKFEAGKRIFLEGCHVGEIGDFVKDLASITDRKVEAACGSSIEKPGPGSQPEYFESAPEHQVEKDDSNYDGWIRVDKDGNIDKLGTNLYVW